MQESRVKKRKMPAAANIDADVGELLERRVHATYSIDSKLAKREKSWSWKSLQSP